MSKVQILDMVDKVSSSLKASELLTNGKYPVYGAQGLIGYLDTFQTDKKAIAIIKDGAGVGRVQIVPDHSSVIGTMQLLIPKGEFSAEYLFYLFSYLDLGSSFSGATIPHIYFKDYGKLFVNYHGLEFQRKAVKELSTLAKLIDNARNNMGLLSELVRSRFNELFSDIENRELLETITTKITDGSHNPPKGIEKSDYIMLSSQNVFDELVLDGVRYLAKEDFENENKRTNIEEGDVLLTIVGTIGRTHVVRKNEKFTFQRSVGVIKPKKGVLDGVYLKTYLDTPDAIVQLESGGHGSSQKGLYIQDIRKLSIPLPDYQTQIMFASFVKNIEKSKSIVAKRLCCYKELYSKKMEEFFGGEN